MTIGGSIALITIGAILAYAVTSSPSWINIHVVGQILMWAGVACLIVSIIYLVMRQRRAKRAATAQQRGYMPPSV